MHDFKHIEMLGLFLGLMLSTGMFAVKAAVGGWHCAALHGGRRPWLPLLLLTPYLILFEAAFWLLASIGLERLSEFSLRYFGLGVLLHLLMCVGLVIWGYRLLVRENSCSHGDHSWMLLAFPCPVCASAILLSCVMAQLLYPTGSGLLRHGLPLAFAKFAILVAKGTPAHPADADGARPSPHRPVLVAGPGPGCGRTALPDGRIPPPQNQ